MEIRLAVQPSLLAVVQVRANVSAYQPKSRIFTARHCTYRYVSDVGGSLEQMQTAAVSVSIVSACSASQGLLRPDA
jgi:hypothetical protein